MTADRAFAHSLGLAIGALVVSAGILLVASWVYMHLQLTDGAKVANGRVILGNELVARMGEASTDGTALLIRQSEGYRGDKHHQQQQHSLVSMRLQFPADNYPFMRYELEGLNTGQLANLVWRTSKNPNQLFRTPIPRNLGTSSTANLTTHPKWAGTIYEIGIHIYGDLRENPIRIDNLRLEPESWRAWVSAIWSEWTSFTGWSMQSINFLKLTPGKPGQETISPTLVMALWAGMALLLMLPLKVPHPISYLLVLLIPWVTLDLLWQREINTQLRETEYLFEGKDMHERQLADYDAPLYRYAHRLKTEVLPEAPQRLFLLHDSDGMNFDRLKSYYHLLPHNIYAYGRYPVKESTRQGDHILLLGQIPDLVFDASKGELRWGDGEHIAVVLIDQDEGRLLFKASKDGKHSG